jgi:hypothetical protein
LGLVIYMLFQNEKVSYFFIGQIFLTWNFIITFCKILWNVHVECKALKQVVDVNIGEVFMLAT